MKNVLEGLLAQHFEFPEDSEKGQGVFFTVHEAVAKQRMKNPVEIVVGDRAVWYEMHRSANNHLKMLVRVLLLNKVPLEKCRVVAIRYK